MIIIFLNLDSRLGHLSHFGHLFWLRLPLLLHLAGSAGLTFGSGFGLDALALGIAALGGTLAFVSEYILDSCDKFGAGGILSGKYLLAQVTYGMRDLVEVQLGSKA